MYIRLTILKQKINNYEYGDELYGLSVEGCGNVDSNNSIEKYLQNRFIKYKGSVLPDEVLIEVLGITKHRYDYYLSHTDIPENTEIVKATKGLSTLTLYTSVKLALTIFKKLNKNENIILNIQNIVDSID